MMRVISQLCACLVFFSALLAGIGEWCPDGCCTEDGKAGACQSTDRCSEHEDDEQSVLLGLDQGVDCCLELSDNTKTCIPKTHSPNDNFQPDAVGALIEIPVVQTAGAPSRQKRGLVPLAIGPPWIKNKTSIELLI